VPDRHVLITGATRGIGEALAAHCLEAGDLVVVEAQVERRDGVGEVVLLRRADDRRGDVAFREEPGESHLRHRDAAIVRDALDDVDDLPVGVRVQPIGVRVVVGTRRRALRLVARAGEHAAGDR